MDSTFWEAVAAVAAVVALVGGAVSWWQANASKAAKRSAELQVQQAGRQVAAAEQQAAAAKAHAEQAAEQVQHLKGLLAEAQQQSSSLQRIAESTAKRPLEAVHVQGMKYRLRNNTDADMVIEDVDNRSEFLRLDWLDPWKELPAGASVEFRAGGASGMPLPTTLVLGMAGEDRPRMVELPPKPPAARN